MARFSLFLACLVGTAFAQAPDAAKTTSEPALAGMLDFEASNALQPPTGWGGGPKDTISLDTETKHGGYRAARIERTSASAQTFTTITKSLPMDFAGRQVELRGFLRTEEVSGFVGLWLRQDGHEPSLAFDNMAGRQLKGTSEWAEYSISLPVHPAARSLYFGVLQSGTGKTWADDLQLLVDGRPIWEAPKAERAKTVLDRDQEFDAGSRIQIASLTPNQVENLATLGKVWGFLKYHHPKVTTGQLHWDYELFRIMPAVLAAPDRAAGNAVLLGWVDALGKTAAPGTPAKLDENELHLKPDLGWLHDEALLGAELSRRLQEIHAHRPAQPEQFFVSLNRGVRNPSFVMEPAYRQITGPDAGFQLLALFRLWNIIRYWAPYRDLVEGDWDAILEEFISRIGLTGSADDYQLQLMALITKVSDTHANLWGSMRVRPPGGNFQVPVMVRFIGNEAVVTGLAADATGTASGLQVGDVIESVDGVPVARLVADWAPYFAASNEPTRLRDIARALTRGPAGDTRLAVRRATGSLELVLSREPEEEAFNKVVRTHDLPGETFQLLSPEVAYLKLSAVKLAEADEYIARAAGTKGMIIDLRNYPAAFVVFALGNHLVDHPVEFARFTTGDPANPGAFHYTPPLSLQPKAPHYKGKVVILVDEVSQSNAEYTTMAFRAAPGAVVVGSTTAGADGNVSQISLPSGLRTMISGIGVFYPDKRPTQRVGIVPDVVVRPTLDGIRAGRDEVLEAGLRQIPGLGEAEVESAARISRR